MSDNELLKLAAKASGYVKIATNVNGFILGFIDMNHMQLWAPLTDDGDALRLAAALRLKVIPGKHKGDGCTVEAQRDGIAGCTAFRDDPAEQMRYAIVHVAAEIGKAMP